MVLDAPFQSLLLVIEVFISIAIKTHKLITTYYVKLMNYPAAIVYGASKLINYGMDKYIYIGYIQIKIIKLTQNLHYSNYMEVAVLCNI